MTIEKRLTAALEPKSDGERAAIEELLAQGPDVVEPLVEMVERVSSQHFDDGAEGPASDSALLHSLDDATALLSQALGELRGMRREVVDDGG